MPQLKSADRDTFLFTVATNGYDEIFKDCLDSHQAYADIQGYKYVAFTKSPPGGISGCNSSWAKVAIILRALEKGYKNIFFIDGDALIHDYTPPIDTLFRDDKFVYMSREGSGKFNAGVIIVVNDRQSVKFFKQLLLRADIPNAMLPKSDRNLFENGHVINLAKNSPIVETINPKWNYNSTTILLNPDDKEYVSHGRGTWAKKPRATEKPISAFQSLLLRIGQGPRYFLLDRILKFYESEYQF